MPVPPEITASNLSARYIGDIRLFDTPTFQKILTFAGLESPQILDTVARANALKINHFRDARGLERIELHQSLGTGNSIVVRVTNYICDGKEENIDDPLLGPMVVKARRVRVQDLDHKGNWGANDDALRNGVVEITYTSDTPRSGKIWCLQASVGIEQTRLGSRLAWVARVSRGAEYVQGIYYMDYEGPSRKSFN